MIYDLIAPFYDSVNSDIDYSSWAEFIKKIIEKNEKTKSELVLDLGCGTGRMTLELARLGYDMTGVDISTEMLDLARDSAEKAGYKDKILLLCQDIRDFELYGTVDVTVSCLDTLNHLTDTKSLMRCLSLVHNYLIPDGLFIFDVNGKHKFENAYSDKSYVMEEDGCVCVWQNLYNPINNLCDFYITLFSENSDGSYTRYDDIQRERMYTLRSIKNALKRAGFEFIGAYSDFDFKAATDGDDRIYVVARCIKN